MQKITERDIAFYIENIPGVVVIDMTGVIVYVNQQCAGYFSMDKEFIMGKHILEIFPASKMITGLSLDQPEIQFYSSSLGIGITLQVPLFKDGEKVGLLEYDATQDSQNLYDLSDGYSKFLDQELKHLKNQINKLEGTKYSIANIIGSSQATMKLKEQIISASKTNSTVLITGETGAGKELVAHAIHNLSSRRKNRFIKVNSAAFPENLVESELFGYDKGAFTGAMKEGKKGKFELADKGTLFIDEINQMPLAMQPKLLRVLQEREIDRIGGDESIPVDVRIIAATNEDLRKLVRNGLFREDLFYRFSVIEICVAPLRERLEDLEELTTYILLELNNNLGLSFTGIDKDALALLKEYNWPGNIRELYNAMERAMNFAKGETLTTTDFDLHSGKVSSEFFGYIDIDALQNPIEQVKNKAERDLIVSVLKRFDNNKSKAAVYLGINRTLLHQKIRRLKI